MKLKVCGMKLNTAEVAALQPDYLGFIFWEPSSRYFEGEIPELPRGIEKVGVFVDVPLDEVLVKVDRYDLQAIQLHGKESPEYCIDLRRRSENLKSGLNKYSHHERTVSEKSHLLTRQGQNVPTDENSDIQPPHEGTADTRSGAVEALSAKKSLKIIKVFTIKDTFDFNILKPYEKVCNYYLFDTKGKLPGGNGYGFDWRVLKDYPSNKPYFLSGGIGLKSSEAIKEFAQRPESKYCYAIDINSKFETKPGLKDVKMLKEFIVRL